MRENSIDTTAPNVVPCGECGADTIAQRETADVSICSDCRPGPSETVLPQRDEPADVPCGECGEPTETTSKVPISICPDCIQRTAAKAGF